MAVDTEKLVTRLYREARVPRRRRLRPLRRLRAWWARPRRPRRLLAPRLRRWSKRNSTKLTIGAVLICVWMVIHLYWYNKLVNLQYNVQASWAQVEAEQERRHHIQLNLIRLTLAYSRHEEEVLDEVTKLRTGAVRDAARSVAPAAGTEPATAASPDPNATPLPVDLHHLDKLSRQQVAQIFPRIMLMSEQYPSLRSTENFQQFAKAVIESETRVTEYVHTYNEAVNVYTTAIEQFPGNIFATVWGFDSCDFYVPERESVSYLPLQYDTAASTTGPAPPPPPPPAPAAPPGAAK